ncbi:hypothetical protein TWF694_009874 [Orbilia ellipsospora]|uniref:Uncharacterized protein n=1 Tax=Orbilia ellipsospora TaxID=2528407 RepID=A0AAV9XEW4_9PEZI
MQPKPLDSRTLIIFILSIILFLSGIDARPGTPESPSHSKSIAKRLIQNPAKLFSRSHNTSADDLSKRHNFPDAHLEILITARWPKVYNPWFWSVYSGYIVKAATTGATEQAQFGSPLPTNASSCRPIFATCDGSTYLEVCNFTGDTVQFKGLDTWYRVQHMMSTQIINTYSSLNTFANQDFWKPPISPHYAATFIPSLYRIDPTLVGYAYMSDDLDSGVAWYFQSPLALDKNWLSSFGVNCFAASGMGDNDQLSDTNR